MLLFSRGFLGEKVSPCEGQKVNITIPCWIFQCSVHQSACIIHDICYGSLKPGRSRQDCDWEFRHNLIKLCRPSKTLILSHQDWLSLNLYSEFKNADPAGTCRDMADFVYLGVRGVGWAYVTPNPEPGCLTDITTPCWRARWFPF